MLVTAKNATEICSLSVTRLFTEAAESPYNLDVSFCNFNAVSFGDIF
jgi:hypothetical protein